MGRYLKIGGIALAILVAGFLLGSGSIGDIVRTWIAGTGASADEAEVEETRQELADRDVENMGQALGTENARVNFSTAVRCQHLTNVIGGNGMDYTSLSQSEIETITANARGIQFNLMDSAGKTAGEVQRELSFMMTRHRVTRELGVDEYQRELREFALELENVCAPLLGRTVRQQNGE